MGRGLQSTARTANTSLTISSVLIRQNALPKRWLPHLAGETANAAKNIIVIDPKLTSPWRPTMHKVEVATVGRVASGMVFLVCAASFSIGALTGFYAIFPPMSLLVV